MELTPVLDNKELLDLLITIQQSRNVVLCAHRGPDGDAVGACLGWAAYLRDLGKRVEIILPNPFPDFLRWMPGNKDIRFYDTNEAECKQIIAASDLIFLLDFNELARLMDMGDAVDKSKADRVMIDHHLNPDPKAARLIISRPAACSTCEVVFRLICQLGGFEAMTRSAAACLYTGMMTDTGGFTYASTNPEIYLIIGQLLTKGIDKDKIYRHVYNNYSEHRLRFVGYILNEKLCFYEGRRASIFTITREEMKRYKYIRGDAEGVVNMPLQVRGMRLSISLREDTEKDVVRVSLRSVDDFPCNKMAAEFFNGGGHLNASGGELPFPLEEAVKTTERAIEAYRDLLRGQVPESGKA